MAAADLAPQAPRASIGDRVFAWGMNKFGCKVPQLAETETPKAEWRFRDAKLRLFKCLHRDQGSSTVVEVGMGAGLNLQLYGPYVDRIVGVDINSAMHPYAQQAAEAAGVGHKLQLLTGRTEALPLESASADAVVMTHVLCTVGDPQAALAEVLRVIKPGGRFIFLEHVAAPPGAALHRVQRVLNPAVRLVGHGCSATRCTLEAIQAAGFGSVEAEHFRLELWALSPAAVVSPHITGTAVK